jgi:hypothetical protein
MVAYRDKEVVGVFNAAFFAASPIGSTFTHRLTSFKIGAQVKQNIFAGKTNDNIRKH